MHLTGRVSKNTALFITAFASFITPFLGSSINVALPRIGETFQMDAITLSWVTTIYLLSSAVFLVPFGKLADIYGRRKIFILGVATVTVTCFFAAFAPGTITFMILRALQGFGSAMIFGTAIAIITSVFPKNERGKAMGINVAAVYVGLTLGPFLGGILTNHFGWESIFLALAPLGLLVFILTILKLNREWAEAKGEKFDWQGSLVYGTALLVFMYGLSILPQWVGFILIGGGILGIYIFVQIEIRKTYPVFNMDLFFRNRQFAASSFTAMINYIATFGVAFLMSLYLQYIKGMTPQGAGQILALQPVVMALFSPITGHFSDRYDAGLIATIGLIILTTGLFLFVAIDYETPLLFIGVVLGVFGLGYAFFSSPNTNAIMSSVDRKYYGLASGTVGTMRLTGQLVSMGIVMLVFSVFIGQVEIQAENYDDFLSSAKLSFVILGVFGILGIILSATRIKKSNKQLF